MTPLLLDDHGPNLRRETVKTETKSSDPKPELERPQGETWRTIDSAPKSQRVIVAGKGQYKFHQTVAEFIPHTGYWYHEDGSFPIMFIPTHWMPLPAPPGHAAAPVAEQPVRQMDWLPVCVAYEQGMGQWKREDNPYHTGSKCWHAYDYGKQEGRERNAPTPPPDEALLKVLEERRMKLAYTLYGDVLTAVEAYSAFASDCLKAVRDLRDAVLRGRK